MPVTLIPDPPLATMTSVIDPPDIGGGVFDGQVFDGFRHNYVFHIEGPFTTLLADPGVVEMVTLPDPVTA